LPATEIRYGLARRAPSLRCRPRTPRAVPRTYEAGGNSGASFDVLPDGRFAMIRTTEVPAREIVVVRNFTEEAKRLTSTR
jgi:hypothetical protein